MTSGNERPGLINELTNRTSKETYMSRQPGLLSLVLSILVLPSCTDEPLAQPPDDPPPHVQQDTTSHDVEWTVYTWGEPRGTSAFYDVFAISDTDVWAVGEVYMNTGLKDSLGREIDIVNVARWNGKEWTPTNVPSATSAPWKLDYWRRINAVFAFASNDVWMATEARTYIHYDGKNFTSERIIEQRGDPKRIWGRTPGDIYICGDNGSLTRYYRGIFHLMETGTDVYLSDIYGADNGDFWTGGYQYWDLGRAFLKITGGKVINVDRRFQFLGASNVWVYEDTLYADVGTGVFIQSVRDTTHWRFMHWKEIAYPLGFIRGFRGSAHNNLFAVGDFGTIIHYNGKTWYMYPFFSLSNHTRFWSVTVTKQNVWCVGTDPQDRAVIYHGKLKQ